MKSSSTPPAVVTMAETCLCCTRYRSVSRRPEEIRLDVYPRKIVVPSLVSASFHARCHLLAGYARRMSEGETVVTRCYFRPNRFFQGCTASLGSAAVSALKRCRREQLATKTHHAVYDPHCFSN